MKKGRKQSFCHTHSFWMFVLPSLALFTIFFLLPLVLSIDQLILPVPKMVTGR